MEPNALKKLFSAVGGSPGISLAEPLIEYYGD